MFLVILTGAGISAESGVQTFRDADGIWAKYDYREVATPEGFANNPALVHEFYNLRRAGLPEVEPNAAHLALAELEEALTARGDRFLLITQNVDDLHARAGSKAILQMHGSIAHARCSFCGQEHEWPGDLSTETPCLSCESVGGMRPAVVWFGEMPRHMAEIEAAVSQATHFVAIGTSGTVYPAAGLAAEARASGAAPFSSISNAPRMWACSTTTFSAPLHAKCRAGPKTSFPAIERVPHAETFG
nr:Sir2 family NAD-dependent protein deacetylase [Parvularcula marina]